MIVRLVNRSLNRRLGKPETGSERLQWTLEECRQALNLVDAAAEETRRELQAALARSASGEDSAAGPRGT